MEEFVGLKSKMYTIKAEDKESKKSRVEKSVVKNEITFDDHKKCLDKKIKQYRSMDLIRSYKHDIFTVKMNKIVLSADDGKREILEDTRNILPCRLYK